MLEQTLQVLDRKDIEDKFKWDLSLIFKNINEWNELYNDVEKRIPELKHFTGKLGNFEDLKNYLELQQELDRKISKLHIYSYLKKDEDNRISENIQLNDKASSLYTYINENTAFFYPEILELSMEYINKFIDKYPQFMATRMFFENLFEDKKHILSKEEEELLAMVSESFSYPSDIADLLTSSDMTFESVYSNGEEINITESNYPTLLENKDREIRKKAYMSISNGYKQFEATLGKTLIGSMKTFNMLSKVSKYESFMHYVLEPTRITKEVFTNTIDTVNENLSVLHDYYRLRKEFLGLEKQYAYDTVIPLIKIEDSKISYDKGVNMVLDALSVLGEDYISKLKSLIDMNVIDVYPNKGKGSGAYSYGCYDVPPYILINYTGTLDDVSTLAHELGHSVNNLYTNEHQPYETSDISIFCAEVASTVNEILLVRYILKNTEDVRVKINVLNDFIQTIIGTVFYQIKYSEFEYDIHKRLEDREALTGEDLSEKWQELNRKYSGEYVEYTEEGSIGWARVHHFYRDFYVYKYATGYAAATQFATAILEGKDGAVENYKKFLSSGTCDYPVEILKKCGVDLTSKMPIESVVNIFRKSIEELKELLKLV